MVVERALAAEGIPKDPRVMVGGRVLEHYHCPYLAVYTLVALTYDIKVFPSDEKLFEK